MYSYYSEGDVMHIVVTAKETLYIVVTAKETLYIVVTRKLSNF